MSPNRRGIRPLNGAWQAYVKVKGKIFSKNFPRTTPLHTMQEWREAKRLAQSSAIMPAAPGPSLPIIAVPRSCSPGPWCYVYFIQAGETVKIGRAKNLPRRLGNLQSSNAETLTFIAVIPGHPVIEAAIHERFAHRRVQGEWYTLAADLRAFIERLREGVNPIALLWDMEPIREQTWVPKVSELFDHVLATDPPPAEVRPPPDNPPAERGVLASGSR